jgi:hypothetical protein
MTITYSLTHLFRFATTSSGRWKQTNCFSIWHRTDIGFTIHSFIQAIHALFLLEGGKGEVVCRVSLRSCLMNRLYSETKTQV